MNEVTEVYTFGQNNYGELALNDNKERLVPTLVENCKDMNIISVAAGNELTLVLTESGQVYSSGFNEPGASSVINNSYASAHSSVNTLKLVEKLDKHIVKIYANNGCEHIIAISSQGEVFAMGYNAKGQLGIGDTKFTSTPTPIAAFTSKFVTTVGLSYYHTVFSCGDDLETYSCGRNDHGQLGLCHTKDITEPTLLETLQGKKVISIGCGQYHTLLATNLSEVYSFGRNDSGQLGLSYKVDSKNTPTKIEGMFSSKVSCGYYHSLAITSTGKLYSWGRNDSGQLGHPDKSKHFEPTNVKEFDETEVIDIACGCYHSLALTYDYKVYTFGRNCHGQLGNNTKISEFIPTQLKEIEHRKVIQVAAGFYHSVLLVSQSQEDELANDLKSLLNNQEFSDITFVVEGKRIHAHRCILMARSEPLQMMVNGPMRESYEESIVIEDVTYDCFNAFLQFLYTDEVPALRENDIDVEMVIELMSIADQYLVDHLKILCEKAIERNIKVKNVIFMLNEAYKRDMISLKKKCISFALKHFSEVIIQNDFLDLQKIILKDIFKNASRKGVFVKDVSG
ncbi:unnamed protein product [Moneuplotes crassus]|uniref:BTB domain-containing protein n=1 Tax=Euplotes crassus TaxID=5936 RepID=A0AAD1UFJ6_EUPCR|nr:unnamed protein product [Moneuplotes crassus]